MWKLTIYQTKKDDKYNLAESVSYVSDDAGDLLDLLDFLTQHEPDGSTRYELTKQEETEE